MSSASRRNPPRKGTPTYLPDTKEELDNFGGGWAFEFPKRNLMQDEAGNLVLLDVIFDLGALRNQRMAASQRLRGW